jgi:hypothetical protein
MDTILSFSVGGCVVTIGNVMRSVYRAGTDAAGYIREAELNKYRADLIFVGLAAMFFMIAVDYQLFRFVIKYVYIANVGLLVILMR